MIVLLATTQYFNERQERCKLVKSLLPDCEECAAMVIFFQLNAADLLCREHRCASDDWDAGAVC
jgi:hypothetical protein